MPPSPAPRNQQNTKKKKTGNKKNSQGVKAWHPGNQNLRITHNLDFAEHETLQGRRDRNAAVRTTNTPIHLSTNDNSRSPLLPMTAWPSLRAQASSRAPSPWRAGASADGGAEAILRVSETLAATLEAAPQNPGNTKARTFQTLTNRANAPLAPFKKQANTAAASPTCR